MIRNPRLHESLGEYVATIRNQFDLHHCDKKERREGIKLLKKVAHGSASRLAARMPFFS